MLFFASTFIRGCGATQCRSVVGPAGQHVRRWSVVVGQPLEGVIFRFLILAILDLHAVELVFCWGLIKATSKHKYDLCHPESVIKLPSRYSECMVTVALAIGCMAASWWPASHIAAAWQPVQDTSPHDWSGTST